MFAGEIIVQVESRVLTEMYTIDSIVLSNCDACCTIQLLCHILSLPHIVLQLQANDTSPVLYQRNISDQCSGGQ